MFGLENMTFEAVSTLDNYQVQPGTLIVAPRRAGKTTFLAKMHPKHHMIVPYSSWKRISAVPTDAWLPQDCPGRGGDVCIDEVSRVWANSSLFTPIAWNDVYCATTGTLDFDELQSGIACEFPMYLWIKHVVVVLPNG